MDGGLFGGGFFGGGLFVGGLFAGGLFPGRPFWSYPHNMSQILSKIGQKHASLTGVKRKLDNFLGGKYFL